MTTIYSNPFVAGAGNSGIGGTQAGNILVSNDAQNIYVTYSLSGSNPTDRRDDWKLSQSHLDFFTDKENFTDVPVSRGGNPQIGRFDYQASHSGITVSYTYQIPLNSLSLRDTDSDGNGETFIATHAAVEKLVGLQTLEYALPNQVTMRIVDRPSLGDNSYFDTQITGGFFGEGDRVYDGWCVDVDRPIYAFTNYTANVYSSYETLPTGLVDKPQNLDLVNWVINQDYVGQASSGGLGNFTYGDVQRAIWTLIDNRLGTAGLTRWNQSRVDQIVGAAQVGGEGFVPDCDDDVAILLQPINTRTGLTSAQVTIGEVTLEELGISCEGASETAWTLGNSAGFPGGSWASYFGYELNQGIFDPDTANAIV